MKGHGRMWERKLWNERIYISAFVIAILKNVFDSTVLVHIPGWAGNFLFLLPLLLFGYKLVMQSYSRHGLAFMLSCIGICVFFAIRCKNYTLVFSLVGIYAMQDVNIRNVLKASIWTKTAILSIHVISYILLNILRPELITYVYRNGVRRHSFFLGHANTFTAYLVWLCLEFIYLNYDKLKFPHYIMIWLLNFIFYQYTDTNTGIIVLTGAILLIYMVKLDWRYTNKALSAISKYIFAVCSIAFPLVSISYVKLNGVLLSLWENLNNILSGRLLYGALAYDVYGFTLFGRLISFPIKVFWRDHWLDGIYFDNAYIGFFMANGILYLALISLAFYFMERRTNQLEKVLIIAFAFYGIMEAYISNIFICFPLLLIGKYFYRRVSSYATCIQHSHSGL